MKTMIPDNAGTTRQLAIAGLLLLASGCATLQDPARSNLASVSAEVAQCAAWYDTLDRLIDHAKVRDAGAWRIPGHPYLRTDRFTASFGNEALDDEAKFQAWSQRLREIDEAARVVELANLPAPSLATLGMTRAEAGERGRSCAAILAGHDLADRERRRQLVSRVRVPDNYVGWQRALGLYPLTSIPFSFGVDGWHQESVADFREFASGGRREGEVVRYRPDEAADQATAAAIVAQAPVDALGVAQLTESQLETLFAAFAPVIEVETTGDFDRIGALAWGRAPAPEVDVGDPVVYRKLVHTRMHGRTLVQLVYVAWLSERPHDGPFDLLAGRLDGIVWRVTLGDDGRPLLYDTIHPCGCFHMFFPTSRVEPVAAPEKRIEWAFVPAPAPQLPDGSRVTIRLASRTHYMVGIAISGSADGRVYRFAEYDDLRMLPAPGGSRSAFRADGLMPGTERGERAFFWPMGVPSAGAMRQWGHHATAFLGRRHFDDADLIERRFRIVGP